ncbi:hypothetical protein [uncultured Cyclobacterium sp.]|uniref:hypothetical protein n=1 Tax=uncultured Cyclobacterium sp. TaxID=453820 RepID=UPI0030EE60EB|tara:strand:+ start:501541 stop:504177 length:2637 start_codon:yes stop_codon:yes gene_type:complete
MSNKLSSVIYQYRNYKADQVLTHTQLNETIAYFEDQDRLTRIALTGVGIVHGLKITTRATEGGDQFVVNQGVGITTDGDLILLHEQLSEEEPKEKNIAIDELSFTHFRVFSDEYAKYSPYFYSDEEQLPIWEFCNEGDTDAQPLSDLANWKGMNMVAYLECYPKSQDICGEINCDNQGIEQISKLHFLMLEDASVQNLVNLDELLLKKIKFTETLSELSAIQLMKVVHNAQNSNDLSQIDKLYIAAIDNGNTLDEVVKGLSTVMEEFNSILEIEGGFQNFIEKFKELADNIFNQQDEDYNFYQYRYLLAKDLLSTYNAIIDALNKFDFWPNPEITSFPKHLLLGKLDGTGYRHDFYKSPALGEYDHDKSEINSLIRKMNLLITSFDIKTEEGLRIIPNGKYKHNSLFPSIPFYYKNSEGFSSTWSANANAIDFYYSMGNNPLLVEHDGLDSYLIGGHLLTDGENTYQAINSMISQFGLEFKLYHFDLAHNQNELKKLFKDHPSCSSRGGVPQSGTYILLSYDNKVFADLSLSYRIVDETGLIGSSHIRVASCSYPWISSLKFLNNLSRSLKGSVKKSGVQPKVYRLVVNNYTINGQSLINGAVTLEIPIEAIYNRRMHAVTEALNERFPKGLVFDYDESHKRFVITRPFDDVFSISFSDNTISINKPSYTYTQDEMVKSDRTFRLAATRCGEIRKYREASYLQLQTEFAPVDKDDDNGEFKGKWKQWNNLIEELKTDSRFTGNFKPRIPGGVNDLPGSVQKIIRSVQSALGNSEIGHTLYLTGDWVTGSWASIEMIDDYKNTTNTNDVIFKFLNLRSILHGKDQATKASLVVVLNREIDRGNMIKTLEPFTEKVDVYIEVPARSGQPRGIDSIQKLQL